MASLYILVDALPNSATGFAVRFDRVDRMERVCGRARVVPTRRSWILPVVPAFAKAAEMEFATGGGGGVVSGLSVDVSLMSVL